MPLFGNKTETPLDSWARAQAIKLTINRGDGDYEKTVSELQAAAAGETGDRQEHLVRLIEQSLSIRYGHPQVWAPVFGVALMAYAVPQLIIAKVFNSTDFRPLGLDQLVFVWIVLAGTSGGVLQVLTRSLNRTHTANTRSGLFFTGMLYPLIGVVIALATVAAFTSGFVTMPIQGPGEPAFGEAGVVIGGSEQADESEPGAVPSEADGNENVSNLGRDSQWTKGEIFLVFVAFLGGFTQTIVGGLGGVRNRGQNLNASAN